MAILLHTLAQMAALAGVALVRQRQELETHLALPHRKEIMAAGVRAAQVEATAAAAAAHLRLAQMVRFQGLQQQGAMVAQAQLRLFLAAA